MPTWRLTGAATLAACTLFACGGAMGDASSDAASVDAGPSGDAIDMLNDSDSDESPAKPYSANVWAAVTIYMAMDGGTLTTYNVGAEGYHSNSPLLWCGGAPMDRGCCYGPAPPVDGGADDAGGIVDMGEMTVGPLGDAGTVSITRSASGYYYYDTGHSWPPGEALTVAATGHDIHPFMGALETGALFKNILPRIDMPVTINRSVDFTISWTAEGLGGEVVGFNIHAAGGNINCFINDSVGRITVPSVLLGQLYSSQGDVDLNRFITRTPTVGSDNADVYLMGLVTVSVSVTVM